MFDRIDYKMDCPFCGEDLGEFQSKDGPCQLKILSPVEVDFFNSYCWGDTSPGWERPNKKPGCGAAVNVHVKKLSSERVHFEIVAWDKSSKANYDKVGATKTYIKSRFLHDGKLSSGLNFLV